MPILAAAGFNQLWYILPLIIAISLVYGATRHEHLVPILHNSLRAAWWIISFMGMIFIVLLVMTWLA